MDVNLINVAQNSVSIGSLPHILPIIIAIVFSVLFIKYSKKNLNDKQQKTAIHILACFISLTIICFHAYNITIDIYNFKTDLPLYICSLMGIIIPVLTYSRKYWMFEILLFWIIGGVTQAIITPDITGGFPSLNYYRFWILHLGLLTVIFYFIFVFKMKPKLNSIFKSILALQIYVFIMMVVNYVLDANYSYLNEKPKSASLLDYFGEWPFYIWVVQLLIVPVFLIIYLPFFLSNRKK